MTSHVLAFEAFPDVAKENTYGAMVQQLQALAPWSDEGPLWAHVVGGWWDTWRNLRTRVDAAPPSRARRGERAAPDSVAGAAADGFAEGAREGLDTLKTALPVIGGTGGVVLLGLAVLFVVVKARS
jgi:hypothetical protein